MWFGDSEEQFEVGWSWPGLFLGGGRFLEAVGAMAAAGLAAPTAAQMIGLGEDHVLAFVVEVAGLGDGSGAALGLWIRLGHASLSLKQDALRAWPRLVSTGEIGYRLRWILGRAKLGLCFARTRPRFQNRDLGLIRSIEEKQILHFVQEYKSFGRMTSVLNDSRCWMA